MDPGQASARAEPEAGARLSRDLASSFVVVLRARSDAKRSSAPLAQQFIRFKRHRSHDSLKRLLRALPPHRPRP
eukprot:6181665-Prymnesium_polylepis.1